MRRYVQGKEGIKKSTHMTQANPDRALAGADSHPNIDATIPPPLPSPICLTERH